MKREKKKPSTYRALAWRYVALVLSFWIVCMGGLTWAVASDMLIQMENQLTFYADNAGHRAPHGEDALPGTLEYEMIKRIGYPYFWIDLEPLLPIAADQHFSGQISSRDWIWGKWELYFGFEAAVIYYDENHQELIRTGDYLIFDYTTAEGWEAKDLTPVGKSYVHLNDVPEAQALFERRITLYPMGDFGLGMLNPLFRFTGWFEGNEFRPVLIEDGSHLNQHGWVTDLNQLWELDSRGTLEWETIYRETPPDGQELVTVYGWEPGGHNVEEKPVTVNGVTYNSLTDLLHASYTSENPFSLEKRSLWESVLIYPRGHTDGYGRFTIAVAVRCRPLHYAVCHLVWVYAVSVALVGLILWRYLRKIRSELTLPLEYLSRAAENGYTISPRSDWEEPAALEAYYVQTYQTLAENKNELAQLRTALDYAHDAEEKRKTLISNITHELKTPLAIIHSYAECLSEDVLPEKRKEYLATILEETEKMDGMVLQMLELSRLEAGRVRLAAEEFSLLELTKAAAEKMKLLMEERNLSLTYDFVQETMVTADEGRMGQVITNLMSNAVKYATEGGIIRISVFATRSTTCFRIANTAPHLTEADLEKVWDSFYRADSSRSTPGTGLGLSLVKSIIALHGGSCSCRNTVTKDGAEAVEFSFDLPRN